MNDGFPTEIKPDCARATTRRTPSLNFCSKSSTVLIGKRSLLINGTKSFNGNQ